jgi:hypothetical protein
MPGKSTVIDENYEEQLGEKWLCGNSYDPNYLAKNDRNYLIE